LTLKKKRERFTVEHNIWERKEDSENIKEAVA